MGDTDLSTQFQAICEKAKIAQEKIEDASANQLRTEVAGTHGKASNAADYQVRADTVQDQACAPWQEIRDRWRSHVAKVKKDIKQKKVELNASEAVENAGTAESYARGATEFALDGIDEAEDAVLSALQAGARRGQRSLPDRVCRAQRGHSSQGEAGGAQTLSRPSIGAGHGCAC